MKLEGRTINIDRLSHRLCGRPTLSGTPCRIQIHGFRQACKQHASTFDDELEAVLAATFDRGREFGYSSGYSAKTIQVESKHRRREREDCERAAFRTHDAEGHQIIEVEVNGSRLAYVWEGSQPCSVGDQVTVPRFWYEPRDQGPHRAPVVSLGSSYTGELVALR
ncbi:Uncharacterised protein [Mycobacteroides abscessus subsp. massiliense]|nr:Uncharacterised protein [Mycobacteroides abscessus subsp. massiliense]SKM96756.1 Uncharacterised protein [Mycobacteroides abscessus subsp. massiliense]SKN75818.1 Uncharacterised protein [Mycobacteroides abscessus subsp. massiliense]SKN97577.1 Uncharacterised protein [Mycobacteroides abscessus subsp. massiliense]SKO20413.1 Uncharacterised protein [Mycobacteroides abscessus subsp. massiliense]